jgi:hypothetical protein
MTTTTRRLVRSVSAYAAATSRTEVMSRWPGWDSRPTEPAPGQRLRNPQRARLGEGFCNSCNCCTPTEKNAEET